MTGKELLLVTGTVQETHNLKLEILQELLIQEYVLHARTRHYRWAILGNKCESQHQTIETQYLEISGLMDRTVELICSYGDRLDGPLIEKVRRSRIDEHLYETGTPREAVTKLIERQESLIERIRQLKTDHPGARSRCAQSEFLDHLIERHQLMAAELKELAGSNHY